MQQPYNIKVSLQEYYVLFQSGKWEFPNFSNKCLICNETDCATYHGFYERSALWPATGFNVKDLPVMRYLCNNKGKKKNCKHVTFSLLPFVLIPYRRLPIHFIILALWIRLRHHLGQVNALAAIEIELVNCSDFACFINIAAQLEWEKIVKAALKLIIACNINIIEDIRFDEIKCNTNSEEALLTFLDIAISYQSRYAEPTIRGPDALGFDFYQLQGGADQLAVFLYGTASQHRF
ncbi:MAG: hypothetical protein GY714_11135 [Desulfobacterales bacterium]|nr:hypothetical protein [Desulfobacterales bacterium]